MSCYPNPLSLEVSLGCMSSSEHASSLASQRYDWLPASITCKQQLEAMIEQLQTRLKRGELPSPPPIPPLPSISAYHLRPLSLSSRRVAADVPAQIRELQAYLRAFEYNHTGMGEALQKRECFRKVMINAKEIIAQALPIKCLEAVVVATYLTLGSPLVRLPLRFKTRVNGRSFWHIVLALRHGDSWSAVGLSRRSSLDYRPLQYNSLSALINSYRLAYEEVDHHIKMITIGLPFSHKEHDNSSVIWHFLILPVKIKAPTIKNTVAVAAAASLALQQQQQQQQAQIQPQSKPDPTVSKSKASPSTHNNTASTTAAAQPSYSSDDNWCEILRVSDRYTRFMQQYSDELRKPAPPLLKPCHPRLEYHREAKQMVYVREEKENDQQANINNSVEEEQEDEEQEDEQDDDEEDGDETESDVVKSNTVALPISSSSSSSSAAASSEDDDAANQHEEDGEDDQILKRHDQISSHHHASVASSFVVPPLITTPTTSVSNTVSTPSNSSFVSPSKTTTASLNTSSSRTPSANGSQSLSRTSSLLSSLRLSSRPSSSSTLSLASSRTVPAIAAVHAIDAANHIENNVPIVAGTSNGQLDDGDIVAPASTIHSRAASSLTLTRTPSLTASSYAAAVVPLSSSRPLSSHRASARPASQMRSRPPSARAIALTRPQSSHPLPSGRKIQADDEDIFSAFEESDDDDDDDDNDNNEYDDTDEIERQVDAFLNASSTAQPPARRTSSSSSTPVILPSLVSSSAFSTNTPITATGDVSHSFAHSDSFAAPTSLTMRVKKPLVTRASSSSISSLSSVPLPSPLSALVLSTHNFNSSAKQQPLSSINSTQIGQSSTQSITHHVNRSSTSTPVSLSKNTFNFQLNMDACEIVSSQISARQRKEAMK